MKYIQFKFYEIVIAVGYDCSVKFLDWKEIDDLPPRNPEPVILPDSINEIEVSMDECHPSAPTHDETKPVIQWDSVEPPGYLDDEDIDFEELLENTIAMFENEQDSGFYGQGIKAGLHKGYMEISIEHCDFWVTETLGLC